MKIRRVIIYILLFFAFLFVAGLFSWYLLGGETMVRSALLEQLRPHLDPSLKADRLSLRLDGATLKRVSIGAGGMVSLRIESVNLKMSLLAFLFGGVKKPGVIKEIEFISPWLNLVRPEADTLRTPFKYRPYPLKSLSELNFLRRITIENARLSIGSSEIVLSDSINGRIDFGDISNVDLSLEGRLRRLPGAVLEVNGTADLHEGSFIVVANTIVNNLAAWTSSRELEKLHVKGGSLNIHVELRGTDDLRLSGKIDIDSVQACYDDIITLTDGSASGELFGSGLDVEGSFVLNGLALPFRIEVADLLTPVWRLEINPPLLDLAQFDSQSSKLPQIKGYAELNATVHGEGDYWGGFVELSSEDILIEPVKLKDLQAHVEIDSGKITVDSLYVRLLGGDFSLTGARPAADTTALDFLFSRRWTANDSVGIFALDSGEIRLSGGLNRKDGVWNGSGTCELYDARNRIQVEGQFILDGSDFDLVVRSPLRGGSLNLLLHEKDDALRMDLSARNPHHIFRGVLSEKYLPPFLQQYAIKIDADGLKDRYDAYITWEALSGVRGGSYHGGLKKSDGAWEADGRIGLRLGTGEQLGGKIKGRYSAGNIKVDDFHLVDEDKRTLLQTRFDVNTDTFRVNHIYFAADSLPTFELLRFLKPDAAEGSNTILTADIHGDNDSTHWQGHLDVVLPGDEVILFESSGLLENGTISLGRTVIVSMPDMMEHFVVEGGIDLKRGRMDSVVVRFDDFLVDWIIQLVIPEEGDRFGGRLNARLDFDGSFASPDLTADVHLTDGLLHGNSGYWMNMRCTTQDSIYNLETLDFGRGVAGLIKIDGRMNRDDYTYQLNMAGEEIEIGSAVEAFTGKVGPLSGCCNFDIDIAGAEKPELVDISVSILPGSIGPLEFDEFQARCNITGFGEKAPVLKLERVTVDWGDVKGWFTGDIGLSRDGMFDVTCSIKGRLPSLLNRLERTIASPGGDGEIFFKIGGDISEPRLTEGYLDLRGGALRLKYVVDRIDDLDARIELDSDNRVNILELRGMSNGRSFSFSNRPPLFGEESIIIHGYDFGILQFETDHDGIRAVIPSLMRDDWGGYLRFSGEGKQGPFEFRGPADKPTAAGEIRLMNATLTYPFLSGGGTRSPFVRAVLDVLRRMTWDGSVIPYQGVRYSREISGFGEIPALALLKDQLTGGLLDVDIKMYVDLLIDDNYEGLLFSGSLSDTLCIQGELTSTQGKVEYLDLMFDVDRLGVIFNPVELEPVFYGCVRTQVIDTLGIPREVRWVVRRSERSTGVEEAESGQYFSQDRGRWDEISFVFEDDQAHSQEQILALFGYSSETLPGKLAGLGSKLLTDATPVRRWTRSLERQVERWLGVDRVDIETPLAQNIIERQIYSTKRSPEEELKSYSYLRTLDHTRVTVGKYLSRDVYVSYTGSLLSSTDAYDVTRIGVVHNWEVLFRMYQIAPNLTLNYRYEFDSKTRLDDNRVFIRFGYTFK